MGTSSAPVERKALGRFEAIVIGSGFGGAVAAARLAARGLRVCLLERGRPWGREDFPRPGVSRERWRWSEKTRGLFEVVRSPRMSLLVASGVGGGSLIYTNIQQRAPEETFAEGWPAGFTRAALDPYYDRVAEMLQPAPIPEPVAKTERLREAARRLGIENRFSLPDLAIYWGSPESGEQGEEITNRFGAAQSACIRCGLCVVGCHVHAKNTLDLNYLKLAERHGAEIFPLHQAESIEPVARGYLVHFDRFTPRGTERDCVFAPIVVVAAGTLGTNRLLLRSQLVHRTLPNLSPRLGRGFSDNGDFFALLAGAGLVQPGYGPTVTAMLNFFDRSGGIGGGTGVPPVKGRAPGFLLFEGGLPDFLAPMINRRLTIPLALWRAYATVRAWLGGPSRSRAPVQPSPPQAGRWVQSGESKGAFDSVLPLFLMGLDAATGRLALDRKGQLQIEWEESAERELFRRMSRQVHELGRALGAWALELPAWRLRRRLYGVHPLGGCALSNTPERGVVNEAGEVFGYPGLYVADGSIVPTALGVPPSMTIAALAERLTESIR